MAAIPFVLISESNLVNVVGIIGMVQGKGATRKLQ
jgi:hypothetical protein